MSESENEKLKENVDFAVTYALEVPDIQDDVRHIKEVLELMKSILVDLVEETAENPAEYADALNELEHRVSLIRAH